MTPENKIYIYEPLWGSWYIDELLGEGSFGKVYKVHRDDFGERCYSAVKLISIPRNETEYAEVCASGMDAETIRNYYRGYIQSIVGEMHMMQRLRGNSNIVSYEDHSVIENSYGVGADILVRMELLHPLNEIIADEGMSAGAVLKMGIDICKALEVCQHYDIIHRDIKPGNIFISDSGSYKLGDFGIARINNGVSELSKKGTFPYMAPEVYRGSPYDSSVDLYSLGIVMYRLLNNNRLPFLPQPPQGVTYSENEQALNRRLNGEPMPPPANAQSGRITDIVMRACAFYPQARYHSPAEMRTDLEDALVLLTDYRVLEPSRKNILPIQQPILQNNIQTPARENTYQQAIINENNFAPPKKISTAESRRMTENAPVYTPQRIRRMTENNRNSNIFYIAWEHIKSSSFADWIRNLPSALSQWIQKKFPSSQERRQAAAIFGATAIAATVIFLIVMFSLGGFGSRYVSATSDSIIGTWKGNGGEIVYTFNSNGSVESSEGKWQTSVGIYSVEGGDELIIKSSSNELVYELKLYKNRRKIILTDAYGKTVTLKKSE